MSAEDEDVVELTPAKAPPQETAPGGTAPAMRTVLRDFARRFDAEVGPLVEPIRRAADTLAGVSDDWPLRQLLPELRELAHQLQVLIDRVAGQQAYVLIFGPLKSGKSTFMNALCAAYVSEVTSLPAYPCIVTVSHGQTPGLVITRYDGRETEIADPHALRDVMQGAHKELMARIRQVEAAGEDFDPPAHMPEAIRKVSVKLANDDLAESGAVLVDTPGLYSRMKFGYERMTRDFRNVAACAIFIVKTDHLFLEQVFEEFQELLNLFSRVFLIVNLDATKRDLAPDGSLVPSVERQDPQRIIDAFRNLSLSGPLKAADDAGRLRIYPVDLLHAAGARIRTGRADPAGQAPPPPEGQASFQVLLGDLTAYLNSSEYLHEFLVDSLRRAGLLLSQLGQLTAHEQARALTRQTAAMRDARAEAAARSEAIGRLKPVDWHEKCRQLRQRLEHAAGEQADQRYHAATELVDDEVRNWFESDASLRELTDGAACPLASRAADDCGRFCRAEMARQVSGAAAGLAISAEAIADLKTVGIELGEHARAALGALPAEEAPGPAGPLLRSEDVPVKRRFWDWMLLRSKAQVRQRLFGPPEAPDLPVPPEIKARRLGDAAAEAIRSAARQRLRAVLDDVGKHLPHRLAEAYAASLSGALRDLLARKDDEVRAGLADLEQRLPEAERILADVEALGAAAERTRPLVDALRAKFAAGEDQAPRRPETPPRASEAPPGVYVSEPAAAAAPAEAAEKPPAAHAAGGEAREADVRPLRPVDAPQGKAQREEP